MMMLPVWGLSADLALDISIEESAPVKVSLLSIVLLFSALAHIPDSESRVGTLNSIQEVLNFSNHVEEIELFKPF